jgi:transposase
VDTLLSLVSFRLLETGASCYAQRWLEGSYARYLYPEARISSQRISEFLVRLGAEEVKRAFFDVYIPHLKGMPDLSENVLIDSTGLPNDIHFEYSKVNNHNGEVSREARLIYVVERGSGLPVYFRYVAGNIVDVSTLRTTINQLKVQGINVSHGILDAGYCSKKNFEALKTHGIPFLTRLPSNAVGKDLIKKHGGDLCSKKYTLKYGDRLICMKRVEAQVYDQNCHVYIALDVDVMQDEQKRYLEKSVEAAKTGKSMTDEAMKRLGCFVMVSSEKLEVSEVLPLYYMRQSIEQTFDFAKNDVDLVPLRTHTEETFRGHLLLCFMSTVALITVKRYLATRKKLKSMCAKMALKDMRFIKCDIFGRTLVMTEANKNANLIINELKLDLPDVVHL